MAEQFSIIKEFRFEAAHLLDGHDGKCNNLHGHGRTAHLSCLRFLLEVI